LRLLLARPSDGIVAAEPRSVLILEQSVPTRRSHVSFGLGADWYVSADTFEIIGSYNLI